MPARKPPTKTEPPIPISRGSRRRLGVATEGKMPELERLTPQPIADADRVKLNIFQKRSRILDEVGIVPKRGWNGYHKYFYTLESDLTAYLAPLFAKYALSLDIDIDFDRIQRVELSRSSSGSPNILTRVPINIVLTNGDNTAEKIVTQWVGEGTDSSDKGLYKALTGAMKFFYMKHFMIATGDDPEAFEQTDRQAAEGTNAATVQVESVSDVEVGKGGYQQHPTEPQIRSLKSMSNALKLNAIEVLQAVDEILGLELNKELPPDLLEEVEINRRVTQIIRTSISGEQIGQVIDALTARLGSAETADDA